MTDAPEHIADPAPASEARADIHLPPPADPAPAERPKRQRRDGEAGRHFGPHPVDDPRTARFDVRCTPTFRARIVAAAKAAGLSLSAFVCARLGDTPGPRAHRNPTELIRAIVQLAAQMAKRGGLLNQGIHALHVIKLEAPEATSRDRLADLLEEAMELFRPAIADHREACAANLRALGLRPGDADSY